MSKLCLFPILLFLLIQITFIVTYISSVKEGHVLPILPFISDTGTFPPESCVFAQFLNIGSVLMGIVVYLRYCLICEVYKDNINLQQSGTNKQNMVSLWLGLIASFGLSMVANFQETRLLIVHMIGACLTFGLGTLYFLVQSAISYSMVPYAGSMGIAHLRLTISVFCLVYVFVYCVGEIISKKEFKGKNPMKWLPSDGGYNEHIASAISEWSLATLFGIYILSFADEFRYLYLAEIDI